MRMGGSVGPVSSDNGAFPGSQERLFPRFQQRRQRVLSPIIGSAAAHFAARAGARLLALGIVGLAVVAMIALTTILGGLALLVLLLALCALWLAIAVSIQVLGRRAERLARTFVSSRLGYDIGKIGGLAGPDSWSRSIERMKKRHDRHASRARR